MSKTSSLFICQQCGNEFTKWLGRCPNCGEWNSIVESKIGNSASKSDRKSKARASTPVNISQIKTKTSRTSTQIPELDRALGGGIVPGQVILIAGEPGVGKSTLLLELTSHINKLLYVSGEESANQVAVRAERLGIKSNNINFLEETDIDGVVESARHYFSVDTKAVKGKKEHQPVLVVDSIQTMGTSDLTGVAGSVGQVRECAYRLVRFAKQTGTAVFIVGHVTKQGSVAGPSVLMHIVDSVLWFEGDENGVFRLLRAHKNRFGPTDEVGVFTMGDKGLVSEINPEKLFLSHSGVSQPGMVVSPTLQGTRVMMAEIQALVVPTKTTFPRRIVQGISPNKFELVIAILIKRMNLPLYDFDCYLNVSGGITIKEPSVDLPIAMALASSYFEKPLPGGTAVFGEVSLLGDVRKVKMEDKRIKEAKKMGYKTVISGESEKSLNQAIRKYLRKTS